MNDKDLIWVDKKLKATYESLDSDSEKLNIVMKLIDDRKMTITNEISNLDNDLILFKAFALKYKNELSKVYEEQDKEFGKLWETQANLNDNMFAKIRKAQNEVKTITNTVSDLNKKLSELNIYRIESLLKLVHTFNSMSDSDKDILKIVLQYNPD